MRFYELSAMARLLCDTDYLKVTQSDNLRELIANNYSLWLYAEQVGQEEMRSKIQQRYDVAKIFTNTSLYDSTLVYYAKNLVVYTENEWVEGTAYTVGQRIKYKDKIYQCITNSTGYLPTNTTYWVYITDDKSLYYVTLPEEEWSYLTSYSVGDVVWYENKTYTCVVANSNTKPDSSTAIWGSGTAHSISNKNPDIIYHAEIAYTVGTKVSCEGVLYNCILNSTGNIPTNATFFTALTTPPYWTKGDNRNPLIVRYLLDITRYHFERSIPARNVSDLCKEAYNGNSPEERGGAIGWLKRVNSGTDNANLPIIVPVKGLAFTYGNSRAAQDNQMW